MRSLCLLVVLIQHPYLEHRIRQRSVLVVKRRSREKWERERYADGDEGRVVFEAFHVRDSAAFIGGEGHHDVPALGEDADGALGIAEEDVARRRAQAGDVAILHSQLHRGCGGGGQGLAYGEDVCLFICVRGERPCVEEVEVSPLHRGISGERRGGLRWRETSGGRRWALVGRATLAIDQSAGAHQTNRGQRIEIESEG